MPRRLVYTCSIRGGTLLQLPVLPPVRPPGFFRRAFVTTRPGASVNPGSATGGQDSRMAASGLARASGTACPLMRLVTMSGVPILRQLQLEERLLRRSEDNWCLINDGTTPPTIVMGMSGRVSELVEIQPVLRDRVPIVRRFSGGGTVIVDQGTVFVTFICNNSAVPGLLPFPRDIMSWSGQLYGKVFDRFGEFHLRENDYAFSHRKFGGNAQSITKKPRWVHHTSFLWDYDVKNMDYLKIPKRAPEYRLSRNHTDFLCRMKELMPLRSVFTDGVITALGDHFSVEPTDLETVLSNDEEFMPTTKLLSQQDLEEIVSSKESPRGRLASVGWGRG